MPKQTVVIARVEVGRHWHALDDDEVVGRGHALHRPDGRVFLSVDTWADDVFHQVVVAMLADLPAPVYTVVDDDDREMLVRWRDAGFVAHRRELEYLVPTDPRVTGLEQGVLPPGVTIIPAGQAQEGLLRELDRALREELDTALRSMPAEIFGRPDGTAGVLDPSRYVVAVHDGRYAGLARVAPLPRRPRLGRLAVAGQHRRRGLARAMLAEVLGSAHRCGLAGVSAEVDELNAPGRALFEGLAALRVGAALELRHD